jgi:hypothetical protein
MMSGIDWELIMTKSICAATRQRKGQMQTGSPSMATGSLSAMREYALGANAVPG